MDHTRCVVQTANKSHAISQWKNTSERARMAAETHWRKQQGLQQVTDRLVACGVALTSIQ